MGMIKIAKEKLQNITEEITLFWRTVNERINMYCLSRGCVLKVDKQGNVTGNLCPRGIKYGIQETTNPLRNITSSIKVSNRRTHSFQ